jgi:hypothetical protein
MSIGRILTKGFGPFSQRNTILTLGFAVGAAAVSTRKRFSGGDDDDHDDNFYEKRMARLARLKAEDDAIIRVVVSSVTRGLLN